MGPAVERVRVRGLSGPGGGGDGGADGDIVVGDVVVFLIGVEVNQLWRPDRWLPVFAAMGPMLAQLLGRPEEGLRGTRVLLGPRGPALVQYWRSLESLEAFSRADGGLHRGAVGRFFRRARSAPRAVGIWHERYVVPAAGVEALYLGCRPFGLAATRP